MISRLFPLFSKIDSAFASFLPPALRIVGWGLLGGVLSLLIYWGLSPQTMIARLKKQSAEFRAGMLNVDAELPEFMSLSMRSTWASLRLCAVVVLPALAAAIPVLVFAAWVSAAMGYMIPVGAELEASAQDCNIPVSILLQSDAPLSADTVVSLSAEGIEIYSGVPLSPPTPIIYKQRWWHLFVGSNVGYLDSRSTVDAVRLHLPEYEFLGFLPAWGRGWGGLYFVSVFVSALLTKFIFKIH